MYQVTRRGAALLIALAIGAIAVPFAAVAQDYTPAAGSRLDALGLPELVAEVSEDGFVAPGSIEAGVTLFKLSNTGNTPVTFALIDAPDEITAEAVGTDLMAEVIGEFWIDSKAPVIHDIFPGSTLTVAVLLEPGSWMLAGAAGSFDEGGGPPITGAEIEITGDVPADAANAIDAAATLELGEYTFAVDGTIPAGPSVMKVTNTHTVPHHAVFFEAGRLYSDEEAHAGFMALMSGASPTADFELGEGPVFVTPGVAGGGTIWIETDFAAGAYLAVCFVADPGQQAPHVMMGMIKGFEVS